MKAIAIAAALAVTSCDTVKTFAPRTTAGFEENGITGALEGASGAVLTGCQALDDVRLVVDGVAVATGTDGVIDGVRAARMEACAVARAVQAARSVDDAVTGPAMGAPTGTATVPSVTMHRN